MIDATQASAVAYMARLEFGTLRERDGGQIGGSRLGARESFWRTLFGPLRNELRLSEERRTALGRAERAEQTSFDVLAETSGIAREWDSALARVGGL